MQLVSLMVLSLLPLCLVGITVQIERRRREKIVEIILLSDHFYADSGDSRAVEHFRQMTQLMDEYGIIPDEVGYRDYIKLAQDAESAFHRNLAWHRLYIWKSLAGPGMNANILKSARQHLADMRNAYRDFRAFIARHHCQYSALSNVIDAMVRSEEAHFTT